MRVCGLGCLAGLMCAQFRSVWRDQPDVHITYSDLAYSVRVPVAAPRIATVLTALTDKVTRNQAFTQLHVLQPCSGRIRPASMTLLLAPPGGGKTSQEHTHAHAHMHA
jgi:hypothetical protein